MWLADMRQLTTAFAAPALKTYMSSYHLWVKLDSAREEYQHAIGAHPEQSKFIRLGTVVPDLVVQSLEGSSHKFSSTTTKSMILY
jgi:hypothetical protein